MPPQGLASLPKPPHSLPGSPLACSMAPGAPNCTQRPAKSRSGQGNNRPQRPPSHNNRSTRDSFNPQDCSSKRTGRDYAQGPLRPSVSPMVHPSFFPTPNVPVQHNTPWNTPFDDPRRNASASSFHSHPSPASTSSGSTSSLRTPPNLLLNGNTMGHAFQSWKASPQHTAMAINSWNGLALKKKIPARHLEVQEILKRKELLQSLPSDLGFALPSPPHTPPASPGKGKALTKTNNAILDADSDVEAGKLVDSGKRVWGASRDQTSFKSDGKDDNMSSSSQGSNKRRKTDQDGSPLGKERLRKESPTASTTQKPQGTSADVRPTTKAKTKDATAPLDTNLPPILRDRQWTKQLFTETSTKYRNTGRERKHTGDKIAQEAATSIPSFATPSSAQVAGLEQLDAILLYCYAFYLDDRATGRTGCIANNWLSLFGLLRYVTSAQTKLGNNALLGLCRLVESCVLRLLHTHHQRLFRDRLSTLTESSPPSKWATFSEGWLKLSSDLERSDRLLSQSRTLLSLNTLQSYYPQAWSSILRNGSLQAEPTALKVDPSSSETCSTFAWPIDPTTPVPHLVCFGRTLLNEHARSRHIPFQLSSL